MPRCTHRLVAIATAIACSLLAFAGGGCTTCGDNTYAQLDAALIPDASIDASTDAAVTPALRNPVGLPDDELAVAALALLGSQSAGGTKRCNACHGLTRQEMRHWRALSDTALSSCLTDLTIPDQGTAREMLDCLRDDPAEPSSAFQAHKLGIYASAVKLQWFEFLVWRAYGDGSSEDWRTELDDLITRAGMPKGARPDYSQPELDIVAEWFARGLPLLDAALPNDLRPTECTPGISSDVTSIVSEMSLSGWRAVNAENKILMFGCGGANTPRECLSNYPRASEKSYGTGWESMPNATLRVLYETAFKSSFWTRSSADGRYVAMGVSDPSMDSAIIDLVSDTVIPTSAFYDPAFFPDNSGFLFQAGRAHMCNQSVLIGPPSEIDYTEPECSQTRLVGLYQHVGAALGGGDYWSVDGQFVSDNGGHEPTLRDPRANFSSRSETSLVPMVHDGGNFNASTPIDVASRFEGDTVISTSSRMLISRVAGADDKQLGYVLRAMNATPTASGYTVDAPEIARYCMNGGKPAFSYDERYMVLHHYVGDEDAESLGFTGADDPAFAAYLSDGAANIYLVDLLTGLRTRVTQMQPGQYALFPHFRSDGWIYFTVRSIVGTPEYIVASDAALVLESGP